MFISNDNNCSFSINHLRRVQITSNDKFYNNLIDDHNYDNVWGQIEFLDNFVDQTRNLYNCYVWQRLLNDTLITKREYNSLQLYNPYTLADHELVEEDQLIDDDELFYVPKRAKGDVVKERKYELNLTNNIKELTQFKFFIDTIYNIRPKNKYETFQKSAIYDILFYRITAAVGCGYAALKNFLWGMTETYFGFAVTELDHMAKMYTKKHTIYVVMRGLGKTTIQKEIAAAAMLCLKDIKILMIAQSKAMVTCSLNEVRDCILKYHDKESNQIFTPPDCVNLYFNVKQTPSNNKTDTSLVKTNLFEYVNKLECVSSAKDGSLRGKNPNFVLVDEFIILENHPTIVALAQRCHCQINYFSSPVYHKPEMYVNIIVDLNSSEDTNLYRMMYFCMKKDHIKFSTTQQACINLWFYMPKHLVYSNDNRLITDVMSSGSRHSQNSVPYYVAGARPSAYSNELGIVRRSDIEVAMQQRRQAVHHDGETNNTTFSNHFFDYMKNVKAYKDVSRINFETKNKRILDDMYPLMKDRQINSALLKHLDFFVYIDPCYNSGTQSGIGFCCVIKPTYITQKSANSYCLVTYLNHYFLSDQDLSCVPAKIGLIMVDCINAMHTLFKSQKKWCNYFVSVENNSQQSSTALIHQQLESIVANYRDTLSFSIYVYTTLQVAKNRRLQGYNLGKEKSSVFKSVIGYINDLNVKFSTAIGQSLKDVSGNSAASSYTSFTSKGEKKLTIIQHLIEECKHFRFDSCKRSYTGKTDRIGHDDLVVAMVMAIFLCKNYTDNIHTHKYTGIIKYPWIKLVRV